MLYTSLRTFDLVTHHHQNQQKAKRQNIQQLDFAARHRRNYYSTDLNLVFRRADGMPSILQSVAVCERSVHNWTYTDVGTT